MENLYLLLITNKASNIIQDLETLRLLSKGLHHYINRLLISLIRPLSLVVPDVAGTAHLTEEKVAEKCFSIIFAFDEVPFLLPLSFLLNSPLSARSSPLVATESRSTCNRSERISRWRVTRRSSTT
jgi:hypothetical protein